MDQNEQAVAKIKAHHAALRRELRERCDALLAAAAQGREAREAQTDLLSYLKEEIVPHAEAEEATIYRRGLSLPELVPLIHAMIAEHERLRALTASLETAQPPVSAAALGLAITEMFAVHADKETGRLLARLVGEGGVSVHQLLGDMHARLEG
jgi:hypothetical protein